MASESGREAASLKRLILEQTGRFEFLQAVRLMKKIWPDRDPVGGDFDPRNEVVRFVTDISPVFARSDIQDAVEPEDGGPAELQVNFMGVATPSSFGALPRRYSEEIRRLSREKNSALREFLDLFNHRMISLFYRGLEVDQDGFSIVVKLPQYGSGVRIPCKPGGLTRGIASRRVACCR